MKKRLDYFDIAKGIGVFLVLLGHLQGDKIFCYSPYILPMCEWIFSFHMPFFFIISGMLISYKNDISKDYKETVKKRFKGIMVPYYWFSLCYMTVVIIAFIKKQIMIDTVLINIWYVICCYGMNVLWFLPTLFFAEILFIFLIRKLDKKKSTLVIIIQCIVALVLAYLFRQGTYDTTPKEMLHQLATTALRPFIACSFVAIGYYGFSLIDNAKSTDNEETKAETPKNNKIKEILICIGLLVLGASFVWVNHGVDFRSLVFKNVLSYYLCACSTSFGMILLCKNIRPFKILKFFGANSLIFMAVHGSEKVAYYATLLAMWANQYLERARGYICYAIIVSVITAYVCIMIVLINKFVPFIAGKPYRKQNKRES